MDQEATLLLLDLKVFIKPIATGETEAPQYIRSEAEKLIARIDALVK